MCVCTCLYVCVHVYICVCVSSDSLSLGQEEVSWVKLNADMTGYYLVHYKAGGWDQLTSLLRVNHTALSHQDRAHLIHNAFQLVS